MAEAIVGPLVGKLQDLVLSEANALVAVNGDIRSLQDKLMWMQAFLRHADQRRRNTYDELIRVLIKQIRDTAIDAEDAIDLFVLKVDLSRWYYQPWQTKPGSRTFHGKKELHLSDRIDTRSAYTFEAKCVVHTLKEYSKLSKARIEDFFCRLEYKVDSATFMPDQLSVYCICEMPYNPDIPMISCPGCKESCAL
nr:unnamed protein product [Digitaria exilis]